MRSATHIETWDPAALDPPADRFRELEEGWFELLPDESDRSAQWVEPHEERFPGEITVLIGPGNSSGATHLLAKLDDAGVARMIGSPTGGSAEGATAGVLYFLRLPYTGIVVRIPWIRQYVDIASFTPGMGVEPDVMVDIPAKEYFEGIDRVFDAAYPAHGESQVEE